MTSNTLHVMFYASLPTTMQHSFPPKAGRIALQDIKPNHCKSKPQPDTSTENPFSGQCSSLNNDIICWSWKMLFWFLQFHSKLEVLR